MTRFGWTIVLSVSVFIGLLFAAYLYIHNRSLHQDTQSLEGTKTELVATTTDSTSLELYSSGDYGFTLAFPKGAVVVDTTASTSNIIINKKNSEITAVNIRLSDAALLVKVSSTSANVLSCVKARPAEATASTTVFGGATWHIFSRDELGTEVELHDTTYRTLRDGTCVTLLAQQPFTEGVTAIRSDLEAIVQSFSFSHP